MSMNMYVLRVRLAWAKGVWREIALLGDHTLADLHSCILEAFEWADEEEPYTFYMTNNLRDTKATYSVNSEDESRHPQNKSLDDFELEEGQQFLYLFGEGEKNQFPIKVMIVDDPDPRMEYPDIVDEDGESPAQDLAYE